jgi:hypothetical protein
MVVKTTGLHDTRGLFPEFFSENTCDSSFGDTMTIPRSVIVWKLFGVSPKAVRDIWNQRTWRRSTTAHVPEAEQATRTDYLRAVEEMASAFQQTTTQKRTVGRPRGSKDSKPRRTRRQRRYYVINDAAIVESQGNGNLSPLSNVHEQSPDSQLKSMQHLVHDESFEYFLTSNHDLDYDVSSEDAGEDTSLRRSYPFFLQL